MDKQNNNTKFQDAVKLELNQIDDYQTFRNLGKAKLDAKRRVLNAPKGYQKARVHLVFDVKHDGRHKARLVCDRHLTETLDESTYSSVVSLRSLRLITFLSALNNQELWGADTGNAYLEVRTKESYTS